MRDSAAPGGSGRGAAAAGTGTDLLRTLRKGAPKLPAVLISGYHDLQLCSGLRPGCVFLHKPFATAELGGALRGVLDARETPLG